MQSELCFSLEEALTEVTRALGGAKEVGHRLRPEMSPADAGKWWLNCTNTDHAQKPSLEQVLLVMRWARESGSHTLMNFIARDCGYSEPQCIAPDDERAELQRQFLAMGKQLTKIAGRLGVAV